MLDGAKNHSFLIEHITGFPIIVVIFKETYIIPVIYAQKFKNMKHPMFLKYNNIVSYMKKTKHYTDSI
jgi:hypothetical protein